MPCYSTRCLSCDLPGLIYRRVADRDNLEQCPLCGETMERVIDKPMVSVFAGYKSPVDGRPITSRAERAKDLKRAKAYEWEPGIEKDIARKQEYLKAEAFKPISDAVDETVRALNTAGKLENLNAP